MAQPHWRRDVIAHRLLTVDDERVYREAERGFGLLKELISRVHFVPIKTDFRAGRGPQPLMRREVLASLTPAAKGERPQIGTVLVFVCEDVVDGFVCPSHGTYRDEHDYARGSTCNVLFGGGRGRDGEREGRQGFQRGSIGFAQK